MKVLQIIDRLEVGGAERVLVDLSNILDNNNVEVSVLCLLSESTLDKKLNTPIKKFYLKRKNKFSLNKLFQLYVILKNYDLIHVHSRQVLRYVGLVTFLPRFLRPFKIVFHDHSLLDIDRTKLKDKFLYYLLKRIDGIIMVCNDQKKFYPVKQKVFLLENIVRNKSSKKSIIRNNKKIVAIGNFRRIKNYEFMLAVFDELPKEYQLDIYVNAVDEKYYAENSILLNRLVNEKRLRVIRGESDLQEILNNYSLAIHTSLSESGPLVAIEYLSVGIPLIMYNTGAVAKKIKVELPELIKEDVVIEEWVKTILKISSNDDLLSSYSKKLSAIFKNEYSEENYVQKCLSIYQHTKNF